MIQRQKGELFKRWIGLQQMVHVKDGAGIRKAGIANPIANGPRVVFSVSDLSCRLLSVGYCPLDNNAELRRKSAIFKRKREVPKHLARIDDRLLRNQI